MYFPPRLHGIENEFAIVGQTLDGTFIDTLDDSISSLIEAIPTENSVLTKESTQGTSRVWHTNGSCTYVDTGDHPEHATAECLSVRDVVKYNKAGEILANRVFGHTYLNPVKWNEQYLVVNPDNIRFLLFKNNLGYDIRAHELSIYGQFGCHENYSIYMDRFHVSANNYQQKMGLFKPLIPFLITRQIFDGSGWWEKNGTFHLSQRAFSIKSEIGLSAVSDRPFFQIKSEDTGADTRLHIISGDANMCEFAIYLKLGTLSLVLALLESGCCPNLAYKNPVTALKNISQHGNPHEPSLETESGSLLSALEIQTIFFEAVRKEISYACYANEKTEAEVKQIIVYWEQTLNAIANRNDEWMRGRIDYATKRYIAEMQIRKAKIRDPEELSLMRKTIDIMYHCVSNPTLQERIKKRWPDRRIVSDDEIDYCLLHAPPDTRARMRGMFVETLVNKGKSTAEGLTWNQFVIRDALQSHFLYLPYGLISNSDEFEKFLLLMK